MVSKLPARYLGFGREVGGDRKPHYCGDGCSGHFVRLIPEMRDTGQQRLWELDVGGGSQHFRRFVLWNATMVRNSPARKRPPSVLDTAAKRGNLLHEPRRAVLVCERKQSYARVCK